MSVVIRRAGRGDVAAIHQMIRELAAYERAPDAVVGTEAMLERALFAPRPSAEALIAEVCDEPAGFALFFQSFSTWELRPGIWLEDLYVREAHRRSGAGRALMARLAQLALERGCARLEWHVLSWNEPAIRFYERIGAARLREWELQRLAGEALSAAAAMPAPPPPSA
ncbi:MAG TPA: GNAT family N-acetyltransferase [Solirubrobacteraceae bacterium]|nr:GNAT family N-acetyltransferase [Solirubrobacteraceae bacterium]